MNNFFTADTHFGHRNIIKLCGRPYVDEDEMTEGFIANWNTKVKPGDNVHHLGDVAYRLKGNLRYILQRLNGNIHLIIGNHEDIALACRGAFASVQHYAELTIDRKMIVLNHYPYKVWNGSGRGSWHLHGHCHGSLPDNGLGKSFDVGVDCHNYAPLSFEEVKVIMDKRPIEKLDHHG